MWARNASARNTEAETSGGFYEAYKLDTDLYVARFSSNEGDTVSLEDSTSLRDAKAVAQAHYDKSASNTAPTKDPAAKGNVVDPETSAAVKTRLDKPEPGATAEAPTAAQPERSEILAADAVWAQAMVAHDFQAACVFLHILSDDERRAAFMEALTAALLASKDERPRRRGKKSKVNRS